MNFKFKPIQEAEVLDFLKNENSYNEERVLNYIKRFKNALKCTTQTGLLSFFPSKPNVSSKVKSEIKKSGKRQKKQ